MTSIDKEALFRAAVYLMEAALGDGLELLASVSMVGGNWVHER